MLRVRASLVGAAGVIAAVLGAEAWRNWNSGYGGVLLALAVGVIFFAMCLLAVAFVLRSLSWRWRHVYKLLTESHERLAGLEATTESLRRRVDGLSEGNGDNLDRKHAPPTGSKGTVVASVARLPVAPKAASTTNAVPVNEKSREEVRDLLLTAVAETPAKESAPLSQHERLPEAVVRGDEPIVTVVVPLFNEERFISDTIASLKRQTVRNFKVIVVDDASTDRSAAVALKAIGADRRFSVARHQRNSGLSASRNTGLRLADTPFITFLDGDDFLLSDSLEIRLREFSNWRDTGLAGVFCGMVSAPEDATINFTPKSLAFSGKVRNFINSEGEAPFNAHAPLLRTRVVRDAGGFDEKLLRGCEDWDLWQRIMRRGYFFAPVNKIAAVYRRKRVSMVRTMSLDHIRTGRGIFERSHAAMAPDQQTGASDPYVFKHSHAHYRERIIFAKRQLQYASMAYVNNPSAFLTLVDEFPHDLWTYVRQELDVERIVTEGLRRMLAVNNATFDAEAQLIEKARSAIISHFSAAAAESRAQASAGEPATSNISHDIAFYPQSLSQLDIMQPFMALCLQKGMKTLVVAVDVVTGDQGVLTALRERGIPHVTYNTFVLQGLAAAISVVMRPYSAVVGSNASAFGARVIEIVDPSNPVHMPDENIPVRAHVIVVPDQFETALEQEREAVASEPVTSRTGGSPAGSLGILGSTAPFVISKEERLDLYPDYARLAELKDRFKGNRCFIVGNGPSLNETDLTLLKDDYSIAVNGIFYKTQESGYRPTFYVVEDSSVMKENLDAIKAYEAPYKFFPTLYRNLHPQGDNVRFFLMNRGFYEPASPSFCVPRFSQDAARRMYCGQSVTHINLQLAYHLGFSEIYLVGMDFSYVIPDSAVVNGDIILSTEDDPNHFHKDYFGRGKTWKDPKLHRVLLNYEIARDAYLADGRRIYNATIGGKLEAFPRVNYYDLFPGKVSASVA